MKYNVTCLYCNVVTGHSYEEGRKTVCCTCRYGSLRDEAKEVAAGMRPWARPLSFWVLFFGQKPMPEEEARIAQTNWDAKQERIRQWNNAHCRSQPLAPL